MSTSTLYLDRPYRCCSSSIIAESSTLHPSWNWSASIMCRSLLLNGGALCRPTLNLEAFSPMNSIAAAVIHAFPSQVLSCMHIQSLYLDLSLSLSLSLHLLPDWSLSALVAVFPMSGVAKQYELPFDQSSSGRIKVRYETSHIKSGVVACGLLNLYSAYG